MLDQDLELTGNVLILRRFQSVLIITDPAPQSERRDGCVYSAGIYWFFFLQSNIQ